MYRLALPALALLASVATGPQVRHVFTTPGNKTVTLKVCNAAGQCSTTSRIVTVLDPRPAISALSVPLKVGSAQPSVTLAAALTGRPPIEASWTISGPLATITRLGPAIDWTPEALGSHQVRLRASGSGLAFAGPVTVTVLPSSFSDVSPSHWAWNAVELLNAHSITLGCAPLTFCPDSGVTREQIALLLVRALRGPLFNPPAAVGLFSDVPPASFAAPFIEQLYRDGITSGCATSPLRYCPASPVTRDQIAVLLLRARHGSSYAPPPATGQVFTDVPRTAFAAAWIEQLAAEGVTAGCGDRLYCPGDAVSRAQAAGFLVRAFSLTHRPVPTLFRVEACQPLACSFPIGLPLAFALRVSGGLAEAYDYDWNGDGFYEETSSFPVAFHTYNLSGTYTPRIRLRSGSWSASLSHPPISIRLPDTSSAPATPLTLAASALGRVPPSPQDAPGTLWRTSFALRAVSQRQTGFLVYHSVAGSLYRPVAVLPGDLSAPLLIPHIPAGSTANLYLVAFNPSAVSAPSPVISVMGPP